MSLSLASQVIERLGPATFAVEPPDPALEQELALAGCRVVPVEQADLATVGIVQWAQTAAALIDRAGVLVVMSGPGERGAVESRLFGQGWSRHPGGLGAAASSATDTTLPPLAYFRRADRPEGDALVRGDSEADAVLALAARMSDKVRPGDQVLVLGEQAPAVGEVLASLSRAAWVEVLPGAAALAELAAREADTVCLFVDAAASVNESLLTAIHRVLRPDGRLLVSWPADQGGIDPVRDQVDEQFISETWVVRPQRRPGAAGVMLDGWRTAAPGDRVLLVASANPLIASDAPPFSHPSFGPGVGSGGALVDFAGAYDNPWLYRVMVQVGERLDDEVKLARLAECVLDEAHAGSADRGAAMAVLGYRVLDRRLAEAVSGFLALIDSYLHETEGSDAPHLVRWRLSLIFLAGRLCELAGDSEGALGWYDRAGSADWQSFSPLLATKAIAARFHAARLLIAAGEHESALRRFRLGLDTALVAAAAPHDRLIGDTARPLPFYLPEMAEVLDMGAQCANAIAAAPLLARDVGLFWRQVDTKRFGLFAWADALARENERLRSR